MSADDKYPIRTLQDFNAEMAGETIFSKIDLVKGYHQIPIHPDDVMKTAIITPFGLFEFVRMPFGLKNSAQAFQRLMDKILRGIPHAFVYIDDILVASSSPDEHIRDLTAVFDALETNGMIINKANCVFGVDTINFLGHCITAEGIAPLPDKVRAIVEYPRPDDTAGLQRFLGTLNYYHRFVNHAADVLRPLYGALQGKPAPKTVTWTPELNASFDGAKCALAEATCLIHPVDGADTCLHVDASQVAMGASLEQYLGGQRKPVGFWSKPLRSIGSHPETGWPAFDHFKYFLEGRPFALYTNQNMLVPAIRKKN
jgi:hypothetical protein